MEFNKNKFKLSPNFTKNIPIKININIEQFAKKDPFEIYFSFLDRKVYFVTGNTKNILDIYDLESEKIIKSLKKHKKPICIIKYFYNDKNNREYLVSIDQDFILIMWDISNKYKIKHKINTEFKEGYESSCLLTFIQPSYIIASKYNNSYSNKSGTKIYSFDKGKFIKYFGNTQGRYILDILLWQNKKDNNYYLIQLTDINIKINNLYKEELYADLNHKYEDLHNSAFILNKEGNEVIYSTTVSGFVYIWDLYNKTLIHYIDTKIYKTDHFILWNDNYTIISDNDFFSLRVYDLNQNKIITKYKLNYKYGNSINCIKKLIHPKYGESLLECNSEKNIKLWIVNK